MLDVADLRVAVGGTEEVLRGITFTVHAGEVHAIMGPNGAGKSTLAATLAGKPDCVVTGGRITFRGDDLLNLSPEERARRGLFLGFQHPVAIPGVTLAQFLKAAHDEAQRARGEEPLETAAFLDRLDGEANRLGIAADFLDRAVNDGLSGGERKRSEMLQLAVLAPALAVLDETDSGLDVDALKVVAAAIEERRSAATATILITHYERLLQHVTVDAVHVLTGGRIIASGGPELARRVERNGYEQLAAV